MCASEEVRFTDSRLVQSKKLQLHASNNTHINIKQHTHPCTYLHPILTRRGKQRLWKIILHAFVN